MQTKKNKKTVADTGYKKVDRKEKKKKEKKEKPRSHGRNQFNQFPQRDYSQKEVSSLEKQLLQGNRS